jgi:hypothetical protein
MTKSEEKGGKGLGTFQVSMVLLGMFLFAFIIENYQIYKRKQLKAETMTKNSAATQPELTTHDTSVGDNECDA